ncbi:Quaternary ammonium compound-resistance protein [Bacillus thuringiensis serovar sotto str. T04001]|nr:Quaternary ammonium compound-resistance protein [Bacillus thuringiensis serovar sotto str. T04001]
MERQYFYKHLGIFIFAQILFIFIVGLVPAQELPSGSYFLHMKEWLLNKQIGFYKNETINTITSVWTSVLIIHFIWAMSYILFPKKKRNSSKQETREEIKEEVKKKKEISINRAWMYLVFGGLIEIYWATGLKTNSMSILTLIAILVSFQLLIEATKKNSNWYGICSIYWNWYSWNDIGRYFIFQRTIFAHQNFPRLLIGTIYYRIEI